MKGRTAMRPDEYTLATAALVVLMIGTLVLLRYA